MDGQKPLSGFDIPEPVVQPVSRISPSRFMFMQECVLQEAMRAGRMPPLLPGSLAAKTGIVIHRMLELTIKGQLDHEQMIPLQWEKEINLIENAMRQSRLEAHLLPLPRYVNNYGVKQQSCFALLKRIMHGKRPKRQGGYDRGVELDVKTRDGLVYGKIDSVRKTGTEIEITDFKSGEIFEDMIPGLIKPAYIIQLKLYAALYFSTFDSWPSRLTVSGLNGQEASIKVDRDECM